MKKITIESNRLVGASHIPVGRTVTVDHQIKTFTIKIRSMNNVGEASIKHLLQSRYEVLEVNEIESQVICEVPRRPEL